MEEWNPLREGLCTCTNKTWSHCKYGGAVTQIPLKDFGTVQLYSNDKLLLGVTANECEAVELGLAFY